MKDRFGLLNPSLFKPPFLISLLVLFFPLNSYAFMTPDNRVLANLVQPVNFLLSRPNMVPEEISPVEAGLVMTAICTQIFWFVVIYLALFSLALFTGRLRRPGKAFEICKVRTWIPKT